MTAAGRNPPVAAEDTDAEGQTRTPARRQPTPAEKVPRSPPPHAAPSEVAGYIEVLVAEMRWMAHSAALDSLAYFLEMARLEAAIQAQRPTRCVPDRSR
ncbi:MAG TPA: hypothetical protein VGV17_21465 [Bosea sp. (in: a-proteobacteria)]|jgi:hypothetical protein|uniref:hypothetical protein n=1 Tax=Bosea sp. (in: a-proteobacteria) TaxID=1871050 RepID=UPI002DDD6ACF|nr:hypothetical protein [Bosea sp. (in: a-proteobacteria)]HEV2556329.1 hypothetical protein [Bosea sp. (in: a-proteobacteria)]